MTFFNPNNRTSGQNPQSGGSTTSVPRQIINSIFGRFPLFYNAGLGDVISPTVDSSLYYPIKPITKEQNVAEFAAGSTRIDWKPDPGKHWMVYFLNAQRPQSPAIAGQGVQLLLLVANQINITLSYVLFDLMASTFPTIPLIGGVQYNTDIPAVATAPIQIEYRGIKSVYLNSDMTLRITNFGNPALSPGYGQIAYLELPENQPFGPTITL